MLAEQIYHSTHPYSDKELYSALMAYLEHEFVFKTLEIDQWLGDERIIYKHRSHYNTASFKSSKNTEEIWYDGEFEDWKTCTSMSIKNICSEFIFKYGAAISKNQKALIKDIIKAEITYGTLVETIKFNPTLKMLIDNGRKTVKGIKPLHYASNKRVNVQMNEGDLCYFCWNTKNPYVANPAYVFRKIGSSYILLFFSNQSKGTETSKLEINMARFINVPADELGLTPEQAVLQRFC